MSLDPGVFMNYGLAGFLAVYLVYFITGKLNRKLDKLIERIEKLDNSINKLIIIIEERRKSIDTG